MAKNELIIDDDYCKAMGNYFLQQGTQLDSIILQYIAILKEIRTSAIMSGDVSDALSAYIVYAEKLSRRFNDISVSAKNEINKFLTNIDQADQYLF